MSINLLRVHNCIRLLTDHTSRTVFITERQLKTSIKNKLLSGLLSLYDIDKKSVKNNYLEYIRHRSPKGYKIVLTYNEKNILIIYDK